MSAVKKSKQRPVRRRVRRLSKDERECAQLFSRFLRQPPQLTWSQVDSMERNFVEKLANFGRTRRGALASLAKSGKEIEAAFGRKADRPSAEAAAELAASIRSMRAFLLAVADCLNTASTRLDLALCGREDMQEICAMVKSQPFADDKPSSDERAVAH